MASFFAENGATILISLGLAAIAFFIIRSMWRSKKRGQACSGGCGGCSFSEDCKHL